MPYTLPKPEQIAVSQARRHLNEMMDLVAAARRCGWPVDAQDANCQAFRNQLDAIEREFMPRRKE